MANETYVTFKDKEVRRLLKHLEKKFKYVKGARKDYIRLLSAPVFGDIMEHFAKERGPKGRWPALKPAYAAWKRKKKKTKMLILSGRMRQSFIPIKSGRQAKPYQRGILWFNPVKYSGKHDRGERVPKRKFMWLSAKAMEKISKNTLSFILDKK